MGIDSNTLPHDLKVKLGLAAPDKPRRKARGTGKVGTAKREACGLLAGQMNKTERAYAAHLDMMKTGGVVLWWGFETFKIRLAQATFYTPDFFVLFFTGKWEVHEVKGHWEDDARVKIKVAAEHIPMRFVAVTKKGDGWNYEPFPGAAAPNHAKAGGGGR